MPRKLIPDNVKKFRGTFTPCRALGDSAEFDLIEDTPPAPHYLDTHAMAYWERIAPILLHREVLTEADLEALEVMCILYGRIRKATLAGMDVPGNLVTQLRLYQAEFGLTPASRPRVKPGGGDGPGNKFSGNGKR